MMMVVLWERRGEVLGRGVVEVNIKKASIFERIGERGVEKGMNIRIYICKYTSILGVGNGRLFLG